MSELSNAFYNAQYYYQGYEWWRNRYLQLLQLQSTQNTQLCECFERPYRETLESSGGNYCQAREYTSTEGLSCGSHTHDRATPTCETQTRNFTKEETFTPNQFEVNEGDYIYDEDEDVEDFQVEVNENFLKFLEQSRQHREEREKLKRKQNEDLENDVYIEAGSVKLNTTTLPPSEKPGTLRTNEMKKLYGKDSSRIQQLETNIQLHYDKNCDTRQPVFWPSIPLKF